MKNVIYLLAISTMIAFNTCTDDIGIIKVIQSASDFPWDLFAGGETNCGFIIDSKLCNLNDIRIWLDNNSSSMVYLTHSRWAPTKIGFTKPDEAIKFSLRFGDYISQLEENG